MKLNKKDLIFAGTILAVLGIFIAISGTEKTKPVPNNTSHRTVYTTAFQDAPPADAPFLKRTFYRPDKKAAERLCEPCHQQNRIVLPPNHPPKNRCLFCHRLRQ